MLKCLHPDFIGKCFFRSGKKGNVQWNADGKVGVAVPRSVLVGGWNVLLLLI